MRAILVALALAIALLPSSAFAVPAFAREYGVPCQTCHVVIGRRNEFGDVFRKWGYHWPGGAEKDRAARKDPPIDTPGIALFTGFIPARIPLALIATMSGAYTTEPDADPAITIGNPSLNLVLGGALGEHLGFFGTWSGQGPPNELFLQFSRILDRPELNLKLGRFEQSTTLFKQNEALLGRFLSSSSTVDGFALSSGRVGIEYTGIYFDRFFLAGGAVQNAGIGTPIDVYYHLSYKIGGMDLAGREPEMDLANPSLWEDFVITLGTWGYRGHVEGPDGSDAYLIRRFGADLQLRFHEANLWMGAMFGMDGDIAALRPVRNLTWFAEASYEIFSWLVIAYLYQLQDRTQAARETMQHDVGVLFLPFENLRVRVKFSISDDGEQNEIGEAQLLIGL